MSMKHATQVLWRFITLSDFRAIHNLEDTTSQGGGQSIVTLSAADEVPIFFDLTGEIVDMCGQIDDGYRAELDSYLEQNDTRSMDFNVTLEPLGPVDQPQIDFEIRYNTYREDWQIPVASSNQAWKGSQNIPEPDDFGTDESYENYYENPEQDPPIIYFIQDSFDRFHAGTLNAINSSSISRYPKLIRDRWERYVDIQQSGTQNTGMVDFTTNEGEYL